MPDLKNPKDEDKKDDEDKNLPDNLDELHEKTQRELEEEDEKAKESDDESDEDEESDDDDAKDKDEEDDKDGDEDEGDGDKDGDDKDDEGSEDKPPVPPAKPPKAADDEKDTKEVEIPKIKVKDSEGKEHEFATVDDIPEDFEPESYKALSVATRDLIKREQEVAKKEADDQEIKWEEERKAKVKQMQDNWDKEIKEMTESKLLPADEKERKTVVDKVFEFMGEQINKGKPIDSFELAFEAYSYRQSRDEQAKKHKEDKKKAGNKVMGGGSTGQPPASQSKVIEAPPRGVSLDDVHAKVLGSL